MLEVEIIRENIAARTTPEPWDIESVKDIETQRNKYEEDRNKWNEALDRVEDLEV